MSSNVELLLYNMHKIFISWNNETTREPEYYQLMLQCSVMSYQFIVAAEKVCHKTNNLTKHLFYFIGICYRDYYFKIIKSRLRGCSEITSRLIISYLCQRRSIKLCRQHQKNREKVDLRRQSSWVESRHKIMVQSFFFENL